MKTVEGVWTPRRVFLIVDDNFDVVGSIVHRRFLFFYDALRPGSGHLDSK